jgi:hypothetical protein
VRCNLTAPQSNMRATRQTPAAMLFLGNVQTFFWICGIFPHLVTWQLSCCTSSGILKHSGFLHNACLMSHLPLLHYLYPPLLNHFTMATSPCHLAAGTKRMQRPNGLSLAKTPKHLKLGTEELQIFPSLQCLPFFKIAWNFGTLFILYCLLWNLCVQWVSGSDDRVSISIQKVRVFLFPEFSSTTYWYRIYR